MENPFTRKVSVNNSEGPPVPIPNTEVKLVCAYNTWLDTARDDRSMLTRKSGEVFFRFLFFRGEKAKKGLTKRRRCAIMPKVSRKRGRR